MKRFIFCMLLAQLALPLQAQDKPDKKHHKLEELVTILQISASQTPEFVAIMNAQHAQREAIHSQHSERRKAEHKAMNTLHQQTIEKLQGVLAESQVAAFQAVMAKPHPKCGNKKHRKDIESTDVES